MMRVDLLDEDGENRAVRTFLTLYSCDRSQTIGAMQDYMRRSGWDNCWPESFYDPAHLKHLTKGGAQLWLRFLFALEDRTSVLAPVDSAAAQRDAQGEKNGEG